MLEKIVPFLKGLQNQSIEIKITGCIESNFSIEKLEYSLEKDILEIKDKESKGNISVNLNQAYQVEEKERKLQVYLDNDLMVQITPQK